MSETLHYDVVVVGAGLAGISAAISASRNGANTLLVERHPYSGGAFTAGLVLHIAGLVDHRRICEQSEKTLQPRNWIVQGLACEYYERLRDIGAARGPHWDHEPAKIVFDQMLNEANVTILYGTQFFSANVADGRVHSVELVYRTHKLIAEAAVFIDASGDGDLGASAGVEHYFGRESDGAMMPATLSYLVAGVAADDKPTLDEINAILKHAWEQGKTPPDMRPAVIAHRYCEGRDRNELWCSLVRQWGNITDPWEYSRMEQAGRNIGWRIFRYLKSTAPSWRDAYLAAMGHQLWPREARHLKAHYMLCEQDVRRQARFDDAVARGAFYLDVHSTTPGTIGFDLEWQAEQYDVYFEIPYRSLIAADVDNLLLAGRTVGADHVAHGAARVMGTGIATGQAAGTAAAILAASRGKAVDLDVSVLQKLLCSQGVIL